MTHRFPWMEATRGWRDGVCAGCGRAERGLTVDAPSGRIHQCAMCLYRTVLHEANRAAVVEGTATVVPSPWGAQVMVPCEWCPPGAMPTSLSKRCEIATGETVYLCDGHSGRGRPVPRTS